MKMIQLRGANACGKSTICRQFVERGKFQVKYVSVKGKQYPYMYDSQRRIVVTGEYNNGRTTDGLDGVITNRTILLDYVAKIIKNEQPEYFVIEALLYGITFSFGQQLYSLARAYGYDFVGILLHLPFNVQYQRLCERNAGADTGIDGLLNKYNTSHSSTMKMKSAGIPIKVLDVTRVKKCDMYKVLADEMRGEG